MSTLELVAGKTSVSEAFRVGPWYCRRSELRERPIDLRDWAIDGVPLRRMIADANGMVEPEQDRTPLLVMEQLSTQSPSRRRITTDYARDLAVEYLDRLLGRAPADLQPEGRVGLLYCVFDLDTSCDSWSADLIVDRDEIHWSRLGASSAYGDTQVLEPELTVSFARQPYEDLLTRLRDEYLSA